MTIQFVAYATNPHHPEAGKSRKAQTSVIKLTLSEAEDSLKRMAAIGMTRGGIDLVAGPGMLMPLYVNFFPLS